VTVDLSKVFRQVLAGKDFRVIQLHHPWLVLFAQNYDGFGSLLARAELPDDLYVGDARGFSVATLRKGDESFIRITSSEKGLPPLFLKLVEFIVHETSAATSAPDSLNKLAGSVAEFKRFVSRKPGRLSSEEIQGLYAEIMVLLALIEAGLDRTVALSSWKGPFFRDGKGLHDFTFPNGRALEVKSSHHPATEIRISTPGQVVPSDLALDVLVLPVESVQPGFAGSTSLREVLAVGKSKFSDEPHLIQLWQDALDAFKTDFEDEYYDTSRFLPGNWKRYQVSEGFPVLDTELIPKAIFNITYSLNLSDLIEFEASPDDLFSEICGGFGV
jgi:hypothetical protein